MKIIFLIAALAAGLFFSDNLFSQVKDIDGNVYKTASIGKQEWMIENLNTEHYRNGDSIPQIQDFEAWSKLTTGAWCYYENNSENGKTYGKLYNWYALNDPRGLAPEGWRVPTDEEWTVLVNKSGGDKTAGKKLKSNHGWLDNSLATNESGFSAIPGGMRDKDGSFYDVNKFSCFWTSSESSNVFAWYRFLIYNYTDVARFDGVKERGMSVRCVKD